ncbi:transcription factor domain-containing protein [Aspergillus undulatus]|uniref:transcription factor domain-containing protein n=1 Tax=Aspergillus undulatus TaxID=1810928 RepID=UPI003CCE1C71
MMRVSKPMSTEQTCFSCHKKKAKCDIAKKTPCTECAKAESKCIRYTKPWRLYNRKQKVYSGSSTDAKTKEKSKDWSKDQGDAKRTKKDPPAGLSLAKDLDAIRNLDRVQDLRVKGRFLGRHVSFDEAMLTPSLTEEHCHLSGAELQLLREQGTFTLPSNAVQHELIATFLEYGHAWAPVIDPAWLTGSSPSFLLLQAIFYGETADFYRRAKLLFMLGSERDPLICVASALLLHFYNPVSSDPLVTDTSGFWLHTAESIAFKAGLHKEPPANYNHRGLQRRLWWTIVVRDCITAVETGRPRTINLTHSDVAPPTLDDFPEQDAHARVFPVYLSICLRLGDTVERSIRGGVTTEYQRSLEDSLFRWVKQDFPGITGAFPGCSFEARQVLVAYLANLIILDRSPALDGTRSARSVVAASFMVGLFREFMQCDETCRLGAAFTFYALTAGLVLIPARRVKSLADVIVEEVIILTASLHILSKQWSSASDSIRTLDKLGKEKGPNRTSTYDTSRVNEEIRPFFAGLDTKWCRLWGPVVDNEYDQTVSSLHGTQRSLLEPYNNAQAQAWDVPPLPVSYPSLLSKSGGGDFGASWLVERTAS